MVELEYTKGSFNGVYFPCFGIFASPLFGSDILPLPPKQEKYHVNLVTNAQTGHYDGNPDSKYEDEIRKHMAKMLKSFNRTYISFNEFAHMETDFREWEIKFPFASHRFGQKVAAAQQLDSREVFRTAEQNPQLFSPEHDKPHCPYGNNTPSSIVTGKHQPVQPIQSREKLANRKFKQDAQKFRVFLGESEIRDTKTIQDYDSFAKVVEHFRNHGGFFKQPKNNIRRISDLIMKVNTVTDMQKWILDKQGNDDFNAYHDGWASGPLLNKKFSVTERTKVSTFMLTCLDYHNFMQIRTQVKKTKILFRISDKYPFQ